ncbi:MAG: hypothetical protein ACYS0D_11770 [Planctomycetota bacterium]
MRRRIAISMCAALAGSLAVTAQAIDQTTRAQSRPDTDTPLQTQPAAGQACTKSVGILGEYFVAEITAFLVSQGHAVFAVTQADIQAGILATLDVLYVNRNGTTDAAAEAVAIESWVRGGGTLVTEFSATQQLFDGATYGFFGAATLLNGFYTPSGDVCGSNTMIVELPGNILASGLPPSWCSGDPYGVFVVYDESTFDPGVKIVVRVEGDENGDGVNEAAMGSACIDSGAIVMFFSDFADWSAPAACDACGRTVDEEVSLNNAVCLGLDACAESEKCFDQPPDQGVAAYSDLDCDFCPDGVQVLAENFNLGGPASIDVLRFWGVYYLDVPLTEDVFTVVFWDSDPATGLPLTMVQKYPPTAATTRTATGNQVLGLDEYEYTIDLEPNQELPPGGYWVEIYNDTSASGCPWDCGDGNGSVATADLLALLAGWGGPGACDFDQNGVISTADLLQLLSMWGACPPDSVDWAWETGTLDPARGGPGFAFSVANGNQEVWIWSPDDLSLNMFCTQDQQPIDCEDANRCQISDVVDGHESDNFYVVADNFVPDIPVTQVVTQLCVRGAYFHGQDCGPGPDDFTVRYYLDAGGLPGDLIAEFTQAGATLAVSPPVPTGNLIDDVATEFENTMSHDPVPLVPGACHWIEVTNPGPVDPCRWFWATSSDGDAYAVWDGPPPDGYDPGDVLLRDFSFCLDVPLGGTPPCPQLAASRRGASPRSDDS